MEKINHAFDLSIEAGDGVEMLGREVCFAEVQEVSKDDGGFDCAGTFGSAGSFGGTLGTVGTFGCCC